MRRLIPFAILGGCLGVGVLPALAANQSVAIHDFRFDPAPVAVMPGEMVSWQADGAAPHSVQFEGEAELAPPSVDFSASKSFPSAGTYRLRIHVNNGGWPGSGSTGRTSLASSISSCRPRNTASARCDGTRPIGSS